jgi:hypothetical protein
MLTNDEGILFDSSAPVKIGKASDMRAMQKGKAPCPGPILDHSDAVMTLIVPSVMTIVVMRVSFPHHFTVGRGAFGRFQGEDLLGWWL